MNEWRWESTPPIDPAAIGKPESQKGWRAMLRDSLRVVAGVRVYDDEVTSLSTPLWEWIAVLEWMPGNRINLGPYQSCGAAKKAVDCALRGIQLQLAARGKPFDATPIMVHEAIDQVNSCECEYCRPHSGTVEADITGVVDE